jgi:hypothetical protein
MPVSWARRSARLLCPHTQHHAETRETACSINTTVAATKKGKTQEAFCAQNGVAEPSFQNRTPCRRPTPSSSSSPTPSSPFSATMIASSSRDTFLFPTNTTSSASWTIPSVIVAEKMAAANLEMGAGIRHLLDLDRIACHPDPRLSASPATAPQPAATAPHSFHDTVACRIFCGTRFGERPGSRLDLLLAKR